MIPLLRRLLQGLLHDEDRGPRWTALLLGGFGTLFSTGGNILGTSIVVPIADHLQVLGPWLQLTALLIVSITKTITPAAAAPQTPAPIQAVP